MSFSNGIALLARAKDLNGTYYNELCLNDPNLAVCEFVPNFYGYRIQLAPNAAFLAIFSLSFIAFVVTYIVTRRGLAFNIALLLGLLCEIIGYAGRIMSWQNQWEMNGFLIQIICLTIGPAFMSAGIYLCLRRIVYAFGPENSRIRPEWYTRLFIPCDVVSLVLQGAGGGIASVASQNNNSPDLGDNIMIAGLAFQVATLLLFLGFSGDFAFNAWRRHRQLGAEAFDQSEAARATRGSWLFRGFVGALTLSTICIFWRSVYRVAELSNGWDGPLMKRQGLFIGFEGVMVVIAVVVLNFFHPSFCIKDLMEGEGGLGSKKKRASSAAAGPASASQIEKNNSEPSSDDGRASL